MKNQQDNVGKGNMGQQKSNQSNAKIDDMKQENSNQSNTKIDDMKQNNIEQVLREELQNEAGAIEKEIEASEVEDISEKQKLAIQKKLQERIARYEMETSAELTDMDIYAKLSKEDREALELGRKIKEEKRYVRKKRTRKMYVALAAALIMVLAIGMTSMGGPERIVSVVKQAIGGREVTKVNSDENNMILENEDEEKAYQEIEEVFGAKPVRLNNTMEGIKFVQMDLDENMQVAELMYRYDEKNMLYIASANYGGASFGIDVEDKIIEQEKVFNSGNEIELTVYEIEEDNSERCMAKFTYHGLEYFLIGTIEKEEFKIILENLYFL